MLTNDPWAPTSRLAFWVSVASVGVGMAVGVLAGAQPFYLGLALGTVVFVIYFFADFERAVIGLLILRSSLDIFSVQQIPAVLSLGIDALTLLYVTARLLTHRTVHTDAFWLFFAGWVALQGLWVVLLPLGELGFNTSLLPEAIREWVRIFSWLMIYLLVMQLKERLHPKKIITLLLLSLIPPVTVAVLQMFMPSILPPILASGGGNVNELASTASRVKGTLGHPNTLATYLLLFIGLLWWKLGQSRRRWPWLLLLGFLTFILAGTKTLVALAMLAVFILVLIIPRLNLVNLVSGIFMFVVALSLFASTDFGQERLSSITNTPLLNPNIDVSRAILLSNSDNNSFNWRLSQWTYLLQAWRQFPIFGYGLGTSSYVSTNQLLPHNDYIRTLVEGGIVGFASFLALLGAEGVRLIQLLRLTPYEKAQRELCFILLAILLALSVAMLTENIWTHTTFFFYWWTLFAISGWNWQEPQRLETPESTVTLPVHSLSRGL